MANTGRLSGTPSGSSALSGSIRGGGTTNYERLTHKPQINDVELLGNLSLDDLGIINNMQPDWEQHEASQGDYIKNKPPLGTASALDVPESGDASAGEVVKGNDSRLKDSRPARDVYDWAKAATKPSYNKSEVGLGNVDNTSDATKKANFTGSIESENAGFVTGGDAYTALSGKAEKSEMSVTDGTDADADKTTIQLKSGLSATVLKTHQNISGKVDKVEGKGLSTNDYDNTEKGKVADATNKLSTATTEIEGNPLSFTTLTEQTAESTIIDLEPIQDLHGYDKPWVGGAGKNLIKLTLANLKTWNTDGTWNENKYTHSGIVYTINEDEDKNVVSIKANGTGSSSEISILYLSENNYSISGSYILNGCPSGGGGNSYIVDVSGMYIDTGSGINIPNGFSNTRLRIKIARSAVIDNKVFYPMLRKSTETDATFQPYTNIASISGRTEIGILGTNGKESTDPDYEISNDLTISLGQTVYGCHYSVENGVLVVDMVKKKFSDSTWEYDSQYSRFGSSAIQDAIYGDARSIDFVSDSYEVLHNSEPIDVSWNGKAYLGPGVGGGMKIWVHDKRFTDTVTFLSEMGDSEIVYPLATPITINLTPNEISLLEGVNNISTDGDKITLTYRNGEVATLGDLTSAVAIIGTTDISAVADGTLTGAVNALANTVVGSFTYNGSTGHLSYQPYSGSPYTFTLTNGHLLIS